MLPSAKVALEAAALGDLKCRNQAALDCLAALSGTFADQPVFPARAVEVSREIVVLARLKFGEQLLDYLLRLSEFRNERFAARYRETSRHYARL
jgi:hypothetical protein